MAKANKPTFVYDYPAALCPLTKRKRETPELAERFELYARRIEEHRRLVVGHPELITEPADGRRNGPSGMKLQQHGGEIGSCLDREGDAA